MEDAANALIMAASVLIFIIALTITISSFSSVRVGIDRVIGQTETVEMAKNGNEYLNYIYMKEEDDATRVVGAETVISSIYRTLKENYVVYIKLSDYNDLVYPNDPNIKIEKKEDADGGEILKFALNENDNVLRTNDKSLKKPVEYNNLMKMFYDKIKDMKFEETLGLYQNNSDVTEENKITYRIIKYKQI